MLYLCSAVLDDQMAQGHVVRNVAKLVDRVDGDAKTFRTLSERDMFRILDHESRDRHPWALALYGLRRGEIAGLRWANVNLTDKTIGAGADALPARSVRIEENRVAVGKQIETGTPKSKASNRTLPMPDEVVDVLKAARKRQTEERLRFGEGFGSGEYVASDEQGIPYHPNLPTFGWGPDARRAEDHTGTTARCPAFVRHADALARRSDRGDRGMAGTRPCGVHDVGLRPQPG